MLVHLTSSNERFKSHDKLLLAHLFGSTWLGIVNGNIKLNLLREKLFSFIIVIIAIIFTDPKIKK